MSVKSFTDRNWQRERQQMRRLELDGLVVGVLKRLVEGLEFRLDEVGGDTLLSEDFLTRGSFG